jgi:hypothetical protein
MSNALLALIMKAVFPMQQKRSSFGLCCDEYQDQAAFHGMT